MSTRVGYAGGTKVAPTYRAIGDHMEAIEVDFDPAVVSYRELLDAFWDGHDPTRKAFRRQYASAIFVRDDAQRREAEASSAAAAARYGVLATEILPAGVFTLAEDYHQKYRLRGAEELDREFRALYPRLEDYARSTSTMRVNAWLDGEGVPTEAELAAVGLSAHGVAVLRSSLGVGGAGCGR